tara:strand:- start:164 stop:643 length:480 start_codon:yes stop_codon:yes gene_type:complete
MENHRTIVNRWLSQMGELMQSKLELDEEGICAITDKEGLIVVIEAPEEGSLVHLYTPLCPMLDGLEPNYAMLEYAMMLNLFSVRTRGGAIGYSQERGELMFSYIIEVNYCDDTRFVNILQNFMQTAKELKANLADLIQSLPQKASEGASSDAAILGITP